MVDSRYILKQDIMKKLLFILMIIFGSACLQAQTKFEINIDSVKDGTVYLHMIRHIPDSTRRVYDIKEIKQEINQINQRIKYKRTFKANIVNELAKKEYTDMIRDDLESQDRETKRDIKRMQIDRLQLMAIRDSVISYMKK